MFIALAIISFTDLVLKRPALVLLHGTTKLKKKKYLAHLQKSTENQNALLIRADLENSRYMAHERRGHYLIT
jgi:hypothetical protein